jgi:aminoglycoside 6'-N-acetyltransferase I
MSHSIRRATHADQEAWAHLRRALWPDAPLEYLRLDQTTLLANPHAAIFVASDSQGQLVGFLEARLRDVVEGCESSPVGYVEAWYVDPQVRGQKVGRALMHAAEEWARQQGCTEMGSDTWLDNGEGIAAHNRLGYFEVDRLVHFVKRL